MKQTLFNLILLVVAAAPSVFAINYHAYTSDVECEGESFYCSDDGNSCCGYPSNFGYSANFEHLPQNAHALGFKNGSCNEGELNENVVFSIYGGSDQGTRCWNGHGFHRATNLIWHARPFSKRVADSVNKDQECYSPSGFRYKDQNGEWKDIKLERSTDMSEAERVAELYSSGDFGALAKYLTS